MKQYNQPKVDFLTLEVKNEVCVSFGIDAASPTTDTGITIGDGGKIVSD